MSDRILNVEQAVMLSRINLKISDHRYGSTNDELARDLLELFITSPVVLVPAKDET